MEQSIIIVFFINYLFLKSVRRPVTSVVGGGRYFQYKDWIMKQTPVPCFVLQSYILL